MSLPALKLDIQDLLNLTFTKAPAVQSLEFYGHKNYNMDVKLKTFFFSKIDCLKMHNLKFFNSLIFQEAVKFNPLGFNKNRK